MRLNYIELFYTLVAAFGSESRRCLQGRGGHMHDVYMQRWLATARPPIGAVGHDLATCKGRLAAARPLARGAHPRARSVAASLQGPTGNGQSARGCHPRSALLLVGATTPVTGVAAPW
ncbi:hypothetical protein BHE74_00034451 [Ensete ventricosum]|nr:hypothetical protein BHE74_00034451 [Ensete ventricosum]